MRFFDPSDLIRPVGLADRHVRSDGQGAVLWLMGVHAEGVALGFQAVRRVEHPPGPHGPDPEEFDLPRMAVVDGGETFDIPALRGHVNSVGGTVFMLRGTYYLRVPDPSRMLSCSVDFLDFTLSLEFTVDGVG